MISREHMESFGRIYHEWKASEPTATELKFGKSGDWQSLAVLVLKWADEQHAEVTESTEINSKMLRAGLTELNEWRSAPLGIGMPVVVKKIYAAMEAAKDGR